VNKTAVGIVAAVAVAVLGIAGIMRSHAESMAESNLKIRQQRLVELKEALRVEEAALQQAISDQKEIEESMRNTGDFAASRLPPDASDAEQSAAIARGMSVFEASFQRALETTSRQRKAVADARAKIIAMSQEP